jgi:hypothetical protein
MRDAPPHRPATLAAGAAVWPRRRCARRDKSADHHPGGRRRPRWTSPRRLVADQLREALGRPVVV